MALLAVNSFIKDSSDKSNPLLRSLAIRTMGYIKIEKHAEYLSSVLKHGIKDEDAYVRKTAAISLAKLHDIDSKLFINNEFFKDLNHLLLDENTMVVSNVIAAINEIQVK